MNLIEQEVTVDQMEEIEKIDTEITTQIMHDKKEKESTTIENIMDTSQ